MDIDPSEIDVKGLTDAAADAEAAARRNLQTRHRSLAENGGVAFNVQVHLKFAIKTDPSQAHGSLQSLNAQLADPNAALGAEAATAANDGVACAECVAQQQQLEPSFGCPTGKILEGNLCKSCQHPQHTTDQETCKDCGANEVPNDVGDGCRCDDDFYGEPFKSTGALKCYDALAGWSEEDFADKVVGCQPCGDCLQCENAVAKVKVEFMISEANKAISSGFASTCARLCHLAPTHPTFICARRWDASVLSASG
jgi:hypothetical protein